ncbi:hypothetical protein XENOCAPTIV_006048, partial [Xenoophorus captivus]
VRSTALAFLKRMYEKDHLRDYIEKFALNYLQLLVHPNPPSLLFGADKDTVPPSPELVERVRDLYHKRVPDVRFLIPVINGLEKVEFSRFLYGFVTTPLVLGLTDDFVFSPQSEVIQALPKLIKLNPIVVKEVFNRLLGTQHSMTLSSSTRGRHLLSLFSISIHALKGAAGTPAAPESDLGSEGSSSVSPLTPGDLLIALHNIDSTKCDMKSIIKATNLCFGEKNVYTSEVLAVVMQQLMEQNPLPMLLMRTVIQSLTMYPRLGGFVMNILSRLIVWKYPKVWEGFVKCCQRTKPQSYSVLLQLPPAQLTSVFERCPEMRASLLQHVLSFTPHQVRPGPVFSSNLCLCATALIILLPRCL